MNQKQFKMDIELTCIKGYKWTIAGIEVVTQN